jgi:hypothetical protein
MPKRVDSDDRITVGEAARILGVQPRAVRFAISRWEDGGEGLPAVQVDGPGMPHPIWMIRRADVRAYQARQSGRAKRGRKPKPKADDA